MHKQVIPVFAFRLSDEIALQDVVTNQVTEDKDKGHLQNFDDHFYFLQVIILTL